MPFSRGGKDGKREGGFIEGITDKKPPEMILSKGSPLLSLSPS